MFANMQLFNKKQQIKSTNNNNNCNTTTTTHTSANGSVLSSSVVSGATANNILGVQQSPITPNDYTLPTISPLSPATVGGDNNSSLYNNNIPTNNNSNNHFHRSSINNSSLVDRNNYSALYHQHNQNQVNSGSFTTNSAGSMDSVSASVQQSQAQQQQQQQQHQQHHHNLPPTVMKPQLVFHCQLAHGSPTGLITGFSSVKELYQKIAECYDFPTEEIIFCTLNTHKVDMTKLLGGQIGLDDFIFAHRKGRPKEIEIIKSEDALGLTITDNGAGYAFIKRIKEGSVIDKIPHIMIGDHIEKLNDVIVVGKRHFEVARLLKDIPTGSTFTLRLVEPMKSGFQGIGPRSSTKGAKKQSYGSGKETLRFKANGNAEIENKFDDVTQTGIDAINALLDSFMGINDSELATQIWDLGADKTNSMDFAEALDNSDLEAFGFTDDFIIELWGAITDARHGRIIRKFT